MRRILYFIPLFVCLVAVAVIRAQSPVALPFTMTTVAGQAPMSSASGVQCPGLPAGVKSTDVFGDGCLAVNAILSYTSGNQLRGGVVVDPFGNLFLADDLNNVIHRIDAGSGIMTVAAGNGSVCSTAAGALDSAGDGCLAATQTVTKGQRGMGIDPYGNVFLAGYNDKLLHVICLASSPICSAAQVGYMELVAGCVATAGGSATGGVGADNVKAAQVGVGSCSASTGEVDQPRGITADRYGNVFFADTQSSRTRVVVGPLTSSYFTGNNPIYAALGVYYASVTPGYMYSVVNTTGTGTSTGGVATIKGNACSVTTNTATYTGSALDTLGDGCPFEFSSVKASSGYTSGVAVDAAGNMLFTDPTNGLRVLFVQGWATASAANSAGVAAPVAAAGVAMYNAILANAGVAPQSGFVYMLAGGGGSSLSATPALGSGAAVTDSTITKLAVSPQGNVYIGDGNKVLFYDIDSGYIRLLLESSTNLPLGASCGNGQNSLSAYSDGCPASKSGFVNPNGLGVSVDQYGNLYLFDSSGAAIGSSAGSNLVRKVLAQGLAGQTMGSPLIQSFTVHLPEAASGAVTGAAAALSTAPNFSAGTPACAQNADNSVDCSVTLTATPTAPGLRSAALTVALPSGTWQNPLLNLALGGNVAGSVLAIDNASTNVAGASTPIAPTTSAVFSGIDPIGVALDGAGNVYTMDSLSGKIIESVQGAAGVAISTAFPANPAQLAVDQQGDVFAVGSGTPQIQELKLAGAPSASGAPSAFTSAAVSYTTVNSATPAPQAIAVDAVGNLFVADNQGSAANNAVYRISLAPGALASQSTIATGFQNPVSLAVDSSGNVFVADKGAGAVYQLTPGVGGGYTQTTLLTGVVPVAVAVDAAGDVYLQDASSASVLMRSAAGVTVTVLAAQSAPSGLAVDGLGNVYAANASASGTSITQVVRGAASYNFGTSESTAYNATLTNAGNQAITGSNTVTNTTNFAVIGGAANACPFTSSVLGALAAGQSCNLSASLAGAGSGTVSDVLSFEPAASTAGSLTLSGALQGTAIGTTTAISGPNPAAPVFTAAGAEATFTVTVSSTSGLAPPTGTVAVTVDSTTSYPSLVAGGSAGQAIVTITGLAAGAHTISAAYATNGSFTGSSAGSPLSFTIAPMQTAVSWSPAFTSQQVSAAIGTGVLNAAVTPVVPGAFVYTATPAGGAAVSVDASTYLGVGTYALAVTFYPADTVDYAPATASVSSFTVTKADTTAVAGATQDLLAADGTGNYTTLAAALAALPVSGGVIYIKPGTYRGQNAISYPNVALRGLGGDPTQVVLTGEDGAFSSPFPYPGSGPGNAGAGGDQGSSTLDVTRSAWIGQQATSGSVEFTPNNFYAEYLTIQNTYNTDNYTTTSWNTSSGTCANSGPSQSLQAVYNAGQQCNSQALALWIESDQAVLNNVNLASQQDTLYAGSQGCGSSCTPARQYMWRGLITGDVDYVFGDAAMVFDHTNFFTTWHGSSPTGTETIEAQNKKFQTGSAQDYLSGYICNGCTLMSQSTGMTNLYFGRPYGAYSTWIMLNSFVDQVNPVGWIEFSNDTNLPTSTYAEFNTQSYTDPAPGSVPYPAGVFFENSTSIPGYTGSAYVLAPTGGNTGAGVTGVRETESQDPGTIENVNAIKTQLTAGQAAQYDPVTFLSATVPTQSYGGFSANWNPVSALAAQVNGFAATGDLVVSAVGQSVTILGRPQTPGAGLIPTGTYTFYDGSTQLATGVLDPSGEAYFTTSTLAAGRHSITMVYAGDNNFNASTSAAVNVTVAEVASSTRLLLASPSSTYGQPLTGSIAVAPQSGAGTPTGSVAFFTGAAQVGSCTLVNGACTFSLTGIPAGVVSLTAQYGGDSAFAGSTSAAISVNIARAVLQVAAGSYTIAQGAALPAYAASISGFVNGDTQAATVTGAPSLAAAVTSSSVPGEYPVTASIGTLAALNYNFAFTSGYLRILPASGATSVATGDTRTVAEPAFPAVCQQLTAAIAMVNNDIPASVDASVSNPDGARIQAALNTCSGTGQAVELSMDGAGNSAFLSGPLSMPANVTLLVDPGVVLFFSRNAQDYDKVSGTHTCGNISTMSATSACRPLIDIPGSSTNVGIMGYGKLDGRGGDPLINAVAPYQGYSWWGLSAAYSSPNGQDNPRFIQLESGASNITLYKITVRNSPLFHVSTTGGVSNVTIWDAKIVTPTTSRNTDGIDPGNVTNWTVTRSWVSDGDDNIAVGASGSAPASNVSITNNHFFTGHGESIGSITEAGVSNILFDGNMSAGNGVAGFGSAVSTAGLFAGGVSDSNSTAIRIKSANDRGGLVTNIQYSNSCFLDHKSDIQFTPLYNTNSGSLTPNFNNILMQNLVFLNDASGAGTLQFTGAVNGAVINPLMVTLDNVTFPGAVSAATFTTSGSAGTETNAQLTFGPGQVSSNFLSAWATFAGSNGDTATSNITASSLQPPACNFTYIAPELTGPQGLPQTITQGQAATAIVILTPAVGGAAYPTGTVTLTDALTGNTYPATLPGNTDTIAIPLSGLSVGTHTFTATYSGDSNYVVSGGATSYTSAGPYTITVNAGALSSTTTALLLSSASGAYGTPVAATATVSGVSPTGAVQFVVSGGGLTGSSTYATVALAPAVGNTATASATLNLPMSATAYSIVAVYSGDNANAGSSSAGSPLAVGAALTTTALSVNPATVNLGAPALVAVSVSSAGGVPSGAVSLSYTTAASSTPVSLGSVALVNGSAAFSAELPVGVDSLTASYAGSGSFAASSASPMSVTVNSYTPIPLSSSPIALAYTITTLVGGAASNCAAATDQYGDGCPGTAIALTSGDDLRSIATDPFGNVYFTDSKAKLIRRVTPNGVVADFAGRVSGTACTAPASTSAAGTGCVPTLVSLNEARGVSSDAAGNILIAGYNDNKVYEVRASDGLMYTVAGTGTGSSTGDGGLAAAATLSSPRGAWADTLGNIYIADTAANRIRVVDPSGYIHPFAGTGVAGSNGDAGPALAAEINNPQGVMVDSNLNVYIADTASVRVVCVTCGTGSPLDKLLNTLGIASPVNGDIYTIAGGGAAKAVSALQPVAATSVTMQPQKLGIDRNGNIYISDGYGAIWFLDAQSGAIRALAASAAAVCSAATNSIGDGCPATQAGFGDNGNGIGVAVDPLGNAYIGDTLNLRIRKVATNLASPAVATGTPAARTIALHFVPGDNLAANGLAYSSSEWSLSTPSCAANADNTADCAFTSTFTPALPGARSTPLAVSSASGNTASLALAGTGLGAGVTLDPARQVSFGVGLAVAGLATDTAGNIYVSDSASKKLYRFAPAAVAQGAGAAGTALATLGAPGAVAVDARGYVYVADTSTGVVTQISPAGVAAALPFTFNRPAGLAVDSVNNLYVADSAAAAVYQINPITGVRKTLALGTMTAPTGLALDPAGNLLVADPGAPAVYRFNLLTGLRSTVTTPAVAPAQIVTDAAGNLLIADSAQIVAVPAGSSSVPFTVAALAPAALAIDAAGNLYTGASGAVLQLARTQAYVQFPAAGASQTVNLLESGNQAYAAAAFTQTDSTDFTLLPTASTDCALNAGGAGTLAVGGLCALTAGSASTVTAASSDVVTFNGNLANAALSNPSSIQLTLVGPSAAPVPTVALGAFSPASPVYGQTVTLSATVSSTSSTVPAGSVVFTVDGTAYSATLANGLASVPVSGLAAGTHSVVVAYTSSNGYAAASSAPSTLTVAQAAQTITFNNPGVQAMGAQLPLVATASSGLPVVFTSQTAAVCTVSGATASLLANGACILQAAQAGNGNWLPAASVTQTFNVGPVSPSISSLAPDFVSSGAAPFTLTVNGSGFVATSTIYWGSTPLTTTYVSAAQLTAQVPAADVASAGITSVTVQTPAATAAASNPLQFEVDSGGAGADPSFASVSVTVQPGSAATYPVKLSASASNVSVQCLNLPPGATCSYSSATNSLTIATSASTPAGTYVITAVFTQTLTTSAAGLIFLPVLLLPLVAVRRKWAARGLWLAAVLAVAVAAGVTVMGCGGTSKSQTQTQTVTNSGSVTLVVQ